MLAFLLITISYADSLAGAISVKTHDTEASTTINQLLTEDCYWEGAWTKSYKDELYDEIRLKETDLGFLPMISGEADRNVPMSIVEEVAFSHFDELTKHLDLVKVAEHLGRGYDPEIGAEFIDSYFCFDAVFMYVELTWRIYRTCDNSGRRIVWFEELTPEIAGNRWCTYEPKIKELSTSFNRRSIFGSLVKPESLYGVFLLVPGKTYETRVVFVARLAFGKETSWIANYASQIPVVLRKALAGAFDSAVAICFDHMD